MIADKEVEEFDFPEREEVRAIPIEQPTTTPAEVPVEPELVPLKEERENDGIYHLEY